MRKVLADVRGVTVKLLDKLQDTGTVGDIRTRDSGFEYTNAHGLIHVVPKKHTAGSFIVPCKPSCGGDSVRKER